MYLVFIYSKFILFKHNKGDQIFNFKERLLFFHIVYFLHILFLLIPI